MRVQWDAEVQALGHDLVEAGQRLVIEAIDRLTAYDRTSGERDVVAESLRALEAQLGCQFHHEEAVMALSRSARLVDQRHEHHRMLDTLAHLRRQHESGQDVTGLLLVNLIAFLTAHLRGLDAEEFGAPTVRWVS